MPLRTINSNEWWYKFSIWRIWVWIKKHQGKWEISLQILVEALCFSNCVRLSEDLFITPMDIIFKPRVAAFNVSLYIPTFSQYKIWAYISYVSGIKAECSMSVFIELILINAIMVGFKTVHWVKSICTGLYLNRWA